MDHLVDQSDVAYIDSVEVLVKRANLKAQLLPHPRCRRRRDALEQLAEAGRVRWVPPTATSLGGWHWVPEETAQVD